MARRGGDDGVQGWLLIATCVAPVLVVAAAAGVRFFGLGLDLALDGLVFGVGRFAALAGVAAAALSVALTARRRGRGWLLTAAGVAIAGASLAGFLIQQPKFTRSSVNDVTSNADDPPGFSRVAQGVRRAAGASPLSAPVGTEACPAAVTIPSQVAPHVAEAALRRAGFSVSGVAAFRAEGAHEGFWFGLTHDAVIRIRPGQTDVRVSARADRPQGEEACRLAARIVAGLRQPG